MNIIGFDFSINKPAACLFNNNTYTFYGWPYQPQKKLPALYESAGVNIITRIDDKEKGEDVSSKMRYEVKNARYLAELIRDTLLPYLTEDTWIGFEGLSYGSSGNVVLQLGGYKYVIMDVLSELVPLENMFTYAPITVKKTAGCSAKGLGKGCMIENFIAGSNDNTLKSAILANRTSFMKKGGKSFVDHLDDLVDAYYIIETLRDKQSPV
jgi:hypothetical protein